MALKGHHAALPYDDMPAFMDALRAEHGSAALALELTILTAARTSEVLRATCGPGGKKPLSGMAMLMLLRRMKRSDITVHGFRSTFRDWAAETTSHPADIAEMALAHVVSNKVEAAYRRGDLFTKRVALMADWAAYCG